MNMSNTANATPKSLATPNDLGEEAANTIAASINPLVADALALYVKTKNFHWHMAGKHYRDYHLLLDEQATQILAVVDPLAERVRKLGAATLRSIGEITKISHIADDDRIAVSSYEMLRALMEDNLRMVAAMRAAHGVCDKYNDIATASLLENFVDETEGRVWFLRQHLVEAE
jgi:starvation-inducible DNA-binding protein